MKNHPALFGFSLLIALSPFISMSQAKPVINSISENHPSIPKLDKFEININLSAAYTNPYDYDEIKMQCVFNSPSGRKDTVDGFFMQDYTPDANGNLNAAGQSSFRVRYAPNEPGNWTYDLSCTNTGGTGTYPTQSFECTPSSTPGFIRKNNSNYLSFDNGAQFIPIGENMGWQNGNVLTDYTNWINKLSTNGGNFIRVWMASWAFALEWKNGSNGFAGLKNYKQQSAFYFDWLLDFCKQKNVYVMATLNNHGQVSTGVNPEWSDNPYNAANGGPAVNTWDFFMNTTARDLHKNRLRYIIARYGYAQSLQSWELFNEIDWTDQFDSRKTAVKDWHAEMAHFIKSKDVYRHLVTTSFARDMNDAATWNLPSLDFSQTHYYVDAPNIENTMAAGAQSYLSQFHKPTLNGEFGLGPDGTVLRTEDPSGIHIHNAIWGSTFGGALGSGLSWWWDDYMEPSNLYGYFKPLSMFVNGIQFAKDDYKKTAVTTSGGGNSDAVIVPAADFGVAVASAFTVDASGAISPAVNQLGRFLFGSVYNTQYHLPPTFNVQYPVPGQFKVVTGNSTGTSPKINIYVDGVPLLDVNAVVSTTYSVNVPAGAHVIKVDNMGTDWILISNYVFSNIGSPVTVYALKSADSSKLAGYVINNQYNWQYLRGSGGAAPPAITGAHLQVNGLQNGNCIVQYFSCSTGQLLSKANTTVTAGALNVDLPQIPWDIAFRVLINAYLFNGSGNWDDATNWSNNALPPTPLPAGAEIIIDPPTGSECILNVPQGIAAGAKLTVMPGKNFRINGNLLIQ